MDSFSGSSLDRLWLWVDFKDCNRNQSNTWLMEIAVTLD